jgi:hypothetical protein
MANKKAPNRALSGEQLAKATENGSDRCHQRERTIQRNNRATRLIIDTDSVGTRVVFAPLFTVFSVFSHGQSNFPFSSTISIN